MRKTAFISTVNSDWSRYAFHQSTQYHLVTSRKLVRMYMEGAGMRPQCGTVRALCWQNRRTLSGWRGKSIGCWGTETRLVELQILLESCTVTKRSVLHERGRTEVQMSQVLSCLCFTPHFVSYVSLVVQNFEMFSFHSPFCAPSETRSPRFWIICFSLPISFSGPKKDQISQFV